MVASSSALPAAQLALRAADKPVFLAASPVTDASQVRIRSTSASFTAADESDSDFPTRRIHDLTRVRVAKTGSAITTWYILIDSGSAGGLTADAWVVEGQNWADNSADVTIRISDTVDGSGLLNGTILTMESSFAVVDGRNVLLKDTSYTGRYWEVQIDGGSAIYETLQFALSTQRQFTYKGKNPGDVDRLVSNYSEAATRAGASKRTKHVSSLRAPNLEFDLPDSAGITLGRNLYLDTDGWVRNFYYIENPNSAPNTAVFGRQQSTESRLPNIELTQSIFTIDMIEEGPVQAP